MRPKVNALEKSWRRTREDALAIELCSSFTLIEVSDRLGKITFFLPRHQVSQVMSDATVNPVIESSLWAYKVSLLLLLSLQIKS